MQTIFSHIITTVLSSITGINPGFVPAARDIVDCSNVVVILSSVCALAGTLALFSMSLSLPYIFSSNLNPIKMSSFIQLFIHLKMIFNHNAFLFKVCIFHLSTLLFQFVDYFFASFSTLETIWPHFKNRRYIILSGVLQLSSIQHLCVLLGLQEMHCSVFSSNDFLT